MDRRSSLHGVLVVDKPQGPTSHDVVAIVRRVPGVERAGHAGTLDPLATGVLAIVIGRATRLASFLSGADKEYVAGIRFGTTTDTYDAEGARGPLGPVPDAPAVARALAALTGTYLQQPPPFSAKKIAGTAAYKLARQGKPVDIAPSLVTVHAMELQGYVEGLADVRLICSSGFYVRSLAHDLGQRLACGAFLERLRRTRSGEFTLDDAASLDAIAGAGGDEVVRERLVPMERLLPHLPAMTLTHEGAARASHGNTLSQRDFGDGMDPWPPTDGGTPYRLIDSAGRLVGIAEKVAGGLLHPTIVLV